VSLVVFRSFLLFLILQIVCTLVSNIRISIVADRLFPYLKTNKSSLKPGDIPKIKNNTLGMVGSKIGEIVVANTNNLLISAFVGVYWVGIYSSYTMVMQGVRTVILQAMDSVTASVGNLGAEADENKVFTVFKNHYFLTWSISYFCSILFLTLFNPFVTIWLGKDFLFPIEIVALLVLNFYIGLNRRTFITFIFSSGLFVKNGRKSVIEAILNLVACLIFLIPFKMGIAGVLLGSTAVNVMLNIWFEPMLVYRDGLHHKLTGRYFISYFFKFSFTVIVSTIIYIIVGKIMITGFVGLFAKFFATVALAFIPYVIVFRKKDEFEFLKTLVTKILNLVSLKLRRKASV
jgi:O-antigen/teichoic acid export membrane protein